MTATGAGTGGDPSSELDFWSRLPSSAAAALKARAVVRRFARGQALFHQGQVADRLLLLRSGRVKVTATTTTGREVVLAIRGTGDLVGELAVLDGAPRSASAVAVEPVEALVLAADEFRSFLLEQPIVSLVLLQIVSRRLREADAGRIEFAGLTTLGRVAARLLELCERFGQQEGDTIRIALPLSQEELAGWTGTSLESTGRALKTMRSLGWIETGRREIRVLDPGALRGAAR